MNLIILTEADALGDGLYELSDKRAEHILSVLKCTPGSTVEFGLLNGPVGVAEIESIDESTVKLLVQRTNPAPITSPTIDIICAVPRPQTLKKVLLISAMMGVRHLHLVRANRTEKSYLQSPMMELENQLPHLIEGLSQGKFTRLPSVTLHSLFRPFVEDTWPDIKLASGDGSVLLLADADTSKTVLELPQLKRAQNVTISIGPEGGWIDYEIEHWRRLGFRPFCLGPWVLRVEHALTASLAQVTLANSVD